MEKGETFDFNLSLEGVLKYQDRVVVSKDEVLKRESWKKLIGRSIQSIQIVVRCIMT